jgi:hypothetical protein
MTSVPSCGERLLLKLLPSLSYKVDEGITTSHVIYIDIGRSSERYWYLAYSVDRRFFGTGYSMRPNFRVETDLPKSLRKALIQYMPAGLKARCISASVQASR